jgi:hypothetical protein
VTSNVPGATNSPAPADQKVWCVLRCQIHGEIGVMSASALPSGPNVGRYATRQPEWTKSPDTSYGSR